MKIFSAIFLPLLLIPALVLGQSNFKPGYVVKNSGDTLKGYIDYKEWVNKSPLSIDFKANKSSGTMLKFGPRDISAFQVDGNENYVSYRGLVSASPTKVEDAPSAIDTSRKADTIFMLRVTTGQYLALYYQADDFKERYFVAETNGTPKELKYFVYLDKNGANVVHSNIYRGQLVIYYKKFRPDDASLSSVIERAAYTGDDLKQLVNRINNQVSQKSIVSPVRLFAGFDLGIASNQATIFSIGNTTVQNTVAPKLNAGIDFFNNPAIQQFIFRAELSLSYNNPQFNYSPATNTNINSTTYQVTHYQVSQYTAAVTPQILFNIYNGDDFKFHVGAGAVFNFSAYSNDSFTLENGQTYSHPYPLKTLWFTYQLQVGATIGKRVEADLTYSKYAAYTDLFEFNLATRFYNVGFKYLFAGK